MRNSQELASTIKSLAKEKGVTIKTMLNSCDMGINTLSTMQSGGYFPRIESIVKLADYLECSVDYLLGREAPFGDGKALSDLSSTNQNNRVERSLTRFAASTDDSTTAELEHIKKYRALDTHGKKMVDFALNEEYMRMHTEEIVYFNVWEQQLPMSAGTGEPADEEQVETLRLIKEPPRGTSYVARVSGDSMEPTYRDGDRVFIKAQEQIRLGQIGVFFMDGKQWIKELGDGELISHNPEFGPRPLTEDIRCQGLVLGVCDESYFE